MTRSLSPDRFTQLVRGALAAFIDQGYHRTQMADIAEAAGVAKGTLYVYVESKEALFDLAVRSVDTDAAVPLPATVPIPTPPPGATVRYVRERLTRQQTLPTLAAALTRQRVHNPRAELDAIVREVYDTLARNRQGIKLLDRSARDFPELAALWFTGARGGLIAALTHYVETRIDRKYFRAMPDAGAVARSILETVAFWAVHRHWDPHPQAIADQIARDTVVQVFVNALVKE